MKLVNDVLHELDNWNNRQRENEGAMRMLSPQRAVMCLQPKDLREPDLNKH
jgi:hypothetical protein